MQPGNVEFVGEIIAALNRGNVEAGLARIAPDFEWRPLEDSPVARVYRGHEQVRRYVEDWLATFDILRLELEEPSELGDHVVVVVRGRGRGRASGVELVNSFCQYGRCAAEWRCGCRSTPLSSRGWRRCAEYVRCSFSTDPVPACAPRCLLPDRSRYDELVDPAPVGTCASSDASASRVPRATFGVTLGAGAPGQR
jgi:ketosteroid isomerase-like protein